MCILGVKDVLPSKLCSEGKKKSDAMSKKYHELIAGIASSRGLKLSAYRGKAGTLKKKRVALKIVRGCIEHACSKGQLLLISS